MVNASQLSLKMRTIPRFLYYEILCSTLIINHKNFLSKSLAAVKQSIGFVILSFKDQKSLALLRAPFILKALMEDWERARDGTQCLLQSLCPYSTALRNWALAMYACVCVLSADWAHCEHETLGSFCFSQGLDSQHSSAVSLMTNLLKL